MLKEVERFARIELNTHTKTICFEKDKKQNKYIIIVDENVYEFDNFKSAINTNITKSKYGRWLTLKDLEKINYYERKIEEIELKGLIIGKDIFID